MMRQLLLRAPMDSKKRMPVVGLFISSSFHVCGQLWRTISPSLPPTQTQRGVLCNGVFAFILCLCIYWKEDPPVEQKAVVNTPPQRLGYANDKGTFVA